MKFIRGLWGASGESLGALGVLWGSLGVLLGTLGASGGLSGNLGGHLGSPWKFLGSPPGILLDLPRPSWALLGSFFFILNREHLYLNPF